MKIKLEISKHASPPITDTDLGYFSFIFQDEKSISNKGRNPNQACMLFASLPDLMDGLHDLEFEDRHAFEFNPISTSISVLFKMKKGMLQISEQNTSISCSIEDFAIQLWQAYKELLLQHEIESVEDLGSGGEDLYKSALNFEILFAYALKDL
jgi:hypothetical protein